MPHLKEFVDKVNEDPELFGKDKFEINYQQGMAPILHMYDADGNEAADPVSISQWKTEHVVEFLTDKLG